jgi:hypothetical protein
MESTNKEPDYKGFGEHVAEWDEKGIPYGNKELVELAKKYNTPIPTNESHTKNDKRYEEPFEDDGAYAD